MTREEYGALRAGDLLVRCANRKTIEAGTVGELVLFLGGWQYSTRVLETDGSLCHLSVPVFMRRFDRHGEGDKG